MREAEARLTGVEDRLSDAEEKLAAMQKLFSTWLDGQIQAARRSINQVAAGPVDEQLSLINARTNERTPVAKGGAPVKFAPVKFGETFDAGVDRINNKRKTLLGK
jgi:hypothetical protein